MAFLTYFTVRAVMSCSYNTSNPLEESVTKADLDAGLSLSMLCVCVCVCPCICPEGFSNWSFLSVTLNQPLEAIQVTQGQNYLRTNLSSI